MCVGDFGETQGATDLGEELGDVVDFVVNSNPAVSLGVMQGHFSQCDNTSAHPARCHTTSQTTNTLGSGS